MSYFEKYKPNYRILIQTLIQASKIIHRLSKNSNSSIKSVDKT